MTHHPIHHHHKRSRVGRLPRWQKYSTYWLASICALSGVGFYLIRELFIPLDPFSARDMLVTHGISAYCLMLAFGAVMPGHIRAAWNTHRNRISGGLVTAVMTLLLISGLGLYYGTEDIHESILWLHWVVGFALIPALPLHILIGRRVNVHHAKC